MLDRETEQTHRAAVPGTPNSSTRLEQPAVSLGGKKNQKDQNVFLDYVKLDDELVNYLIF